MKKKKLERLDTYVPPLLEARGQLIRVGRVMRECGQPWLARLSAARLPCVLALHGRTAAKAYCKAACPCARMST